MRVGRWVRQLPGEGAQRAIAMLNHGDSERSETIMLEYLVGSDINAFQTNSKHERGNPCN